MNAREVARIIEDKLGRLRGMVDYVTDLVFEDDGTASAKGAKVDDDDGEALTPTVAWHLGFYSRPLDGASGIVLKADGRGGTSFLIGYRNRQYEISLEKGECAMVNEAGAFVKCNKDAVVEVNGTDYHLPKFDHFLNGDVTASPPGSLYTSLSGAIGFIVGCLQTPCVSGSPLLVPGGPAEANLLDFIARLAASEYLSQKGKNG